MPRKQTELEAAPAVQNAELRPLQALLAAIAAAPDLSEQVAALQDAQSIFDNIRQKAGQAHSHNYAADLNSTHAALVAAQARHDIGRATDEDLGRAKAAYASAQEKANMAPGRRAVLLEELEHARDAISAAVDALDDAQRDWAEVVEGTAYQAEAEAVELLLTASHALAIIDPERGQVSALQLLSALPHYSDHFAGGVATSIRSAAKDPDGTYLSQTVRRRATRALEFVAGGDPISASMAEHREAQLSPDAIERSRQAALEKANQGHYVPPPAEPTEEISNSGLEGFKYPPPRPDEPKNTAPYSQF